MSKITQLMREELPNMTYQKKLSYRPSQSDVVKLFKLLNEEIFNNKLPMPEIEVAARCRKYWGYCIGLEILELTTDKSNCKIKLMDKWFCKQWLITTLAHEMVHQYQWDIDGVKRIKQGKDPIMSHGPSFYKHKKKLAKFGISLKKAHGRKKWFKHQNFNKC